LAEPGRHPEILHFQAAHVAKSIRGTEAEIHARLRELTEEFRQLRRELSDTTKKRVSGKGSILGSARRGVPSELKRKPR
jgi:hypothetical protein